jgi:valyl-tRNA synthetase
LKVQYQWKIPREKRDLFRQKCVEWTESMIHSMKNSMIKMGYRPDWEQFEYRTMDPSYWKNVQSTLLTFHDKGLIYRDEFPIHWCPNCGTALAQAELGYIDEPGKLYYIKFPRKGGYIEIATTRPELIPACQAVVVNPKDERYTDLIGKEAEIPIFGRKIPIFSDSAVEPTFGTGMVMVCTFGDDQDVRWQQKYNLPINKVIDEKGKLINSGKYNGMTVEEGRTAIVSDLHDMGLVVKSEDIIHKILSHTERSDCLSPIEFLIKKQWFIKTKPFLEDVVQACKKMRWTPEFMFQRLIDWVNSIEWDWLISRQRIYGTPIPFWYCEDCNEPIPARVDQLPVNPPEDTTPLKSCPRCGSSNIKPSEDVCDCWVDSSITPLVISGYFESAPHYCRTYPADVRQQGHDIIRTWLFYTVFRCLILRDNPPFKQVLINGHILGPDGYKMSKSRGNVIDPSHRLKEFGADSLRQALLSITMGSDLPFNWDSVKYGKGFLQKYWSASRFVQRFINDYQPFDHNIESLTLIDRWILSKLARVVKKVTEALDNYQFHVAIELIRNFFWHDFCDQYIEASKHRLYDSISPDDRASVIYTLYTVTWNSTLMLSPICPHIVEEVHSKVFNNTGLLSIHSAKWPNVNDIPSSRKMEKEGEVIVQAVSDIRKEKSNSGMPLSSKISRAVIKAPMDSLEILRKNEEVIKRILHIEALRFVASNSFESSLG